MPAGSGGSWYLMVATPVMSLPANRYVPGVAGSSTWTLWGTPSCLLSNVSVTGVLAGMTIWPWSKWVAADADRYGVVVAGGPWSPAAACLGRNVSSQGPSVSTIATSGDTHEHRHQLVGEHLDRVAGHRLRLVAGFHLHELPIGVDVPAGGRGEGHHDARHDEQRTQDETQEHEEQADGREEGPRAGAGHVDALGDDHRRRLPVGLRHQPQAVVVGIDLLVLAVGVPVPARRADDRDEQSRDRDGDVQEDAATAADREREEDEHQTDGRHERPQGAAGHVHAAGHRSRRQGPRHARCVARGVAMPHRDQAQQRQHQQAEEQQRDVLEQGRPEGRDDLADEVEGRVPEDPWSPISSGGPGRSSYVAGAADEHGQPEHHRDTREDAASARP